MKTLALRVSDPAHQTDIGCRYRCISFGGMALKSVNGSALKDELDRSPSSTSISQNEAYNKLDITGGGRSSLDHTQSAAAAAAAAVPVDRTIARKGDGELRGRASCAGGGDEKSDDRANSRGFHTAAVPGGHRERSASTQNSRRLRDTRKSLVDRQTESLGWATKPAGDAAVVARHRQILPLRNGTSDRRRASSPSAAHTSLPDLLMPSSTSANFFGSFDDSRYWDYAFRLTLKGDMGHHCRECKRPFSVLNETIAVRRSGKPRRRYSWR